jgi:putative tryptophan/tyrosine transport system substrate-binding protein
MMRRRAFITLLGGAAVTWPLPARAQQPDLVRRVGILISGAEADPEMQARVVAIRQRLGSLGWSEGRNLRIDIRFADGDPDRHSSLAKALVASQPDAIIAYSTPIAAALRRESRTIPIVFVNVSDPVGSGLVASLARPGGNLTGLMLYEEGITGKWLAMLKEIAPHLTRAALIANPKSTPYDYFVRAAEAAASSLAVEVVPSPIENIADIERVIESLARLPNGGLVLLPDSTSIQHRDLVVLLAARHRLPAVYAFRFFVAAGGLMSYGTDIIEQYREAASYVDRILRGANPADLPVQAPTKYETVLNLKTAKSLGLEVPPSLLVRADEVIE